MNAVAAQHSDTLARNYSQLTGLSLLRAMAEVEFPGTLAVTSSFGIEAAVLLDLVAQIDRDLPVIVLDTGELFDETVAYRKHLVDFLGLRDVRVIRPEPDDLASADGLWRSDPDRCCHLRKVAPLAKAVRGFRALVDGRKRIHGGDRSVLPGIQAGEGGLVKISPLATWDEAQIEQAFVSRRLPRHPLLAQGYRSVGCWPCTRPVAAGEGPRDGRWAGMAKTECGIHRPLDGQGQPGGEL